LKKNNNQKKKNKNKKQYIICLGCVCLLYVANAVLSLLTITLNYEQEDSNYSQELAPVFYFQLNGIAGGEGAQLALFIILVVINLGVIFLTFSILVFGNYFIIIYFLNFNSFLFFHYSFPLFLLFFTIYSSFILLFNAMIIISYSNSSIVISRNESIFNRSW